MHLTRTRKRVAALAVAIAMGAGATGVFAFMISGPVGSGTITEVGGHPASVPVTVSVTNEYAPVAFVPGVDNEVGVTITNTGASSVLISGVSMTWSSNQAGCDPGDLPGQFVIAFSRASFNGTEAGVALPLTLTPSGPTNNVDAIYDVTMQNLAQDQSSCEGATFTFTYTVS